MNKLLFGLVLLATMITARATGQTLTQLTAQYKKTTDSFNTVLRLLRWQASRDSVNYVALKSQVDGLAAAAKTTAGKLAKYDSSILKVDTSAASTLRLKGNVISAQPVDLVAFRKTLLADVQLLIPPPDSRLPALFDFWDRYKIYLSQYPR